MGKKKYCEIASTALDQSGGGIWKVRNTCKCMYICVCVHVTSGHEGNDTKLSVVSKQSM